MRQYFRISLAGELKAFCEKSGTNRFKIFNNAVMNQTDEVPRKKRMRIANLRPSMRCPASVSDASFCIKLNGFDLLTTLRNARNGTRTVKPDVVNRRTPARVVSAVLKPAKSFKKDRHDISIACSRNNSTHDSLAFN